MHNLLFGLAFHSVIVLSGECRKIGSSTSHSEHSDESRESGQAQKKQELLGQDTVKINEAEYKLQSLVSPEFHESSKYFQRPIKQFGDLQLDTLSPAQVNFLQTPRVWPKYAEPKENQGTIYPENPVPFPISKNNAEDEDHAKQLWNPDYFSRADFGSPERSYGRDSQDDNKSWWGSDKDYSNNPNDPSSNYQSYPTEEGNSNIPKEGVLNMQGSAKFSVNRASQMDGNTQRNQENFPQMFQGNIFGAAGHQAGSLDGQNLLGQGGQQNLAGSEGTKPGLFGGQFSPQLDSSNSLTNEEHLWSSQVRQEKQGILKGLKEAASIVDGEAKGQRLSTTPLFGDEETKANARSLHGNNKMHAFHASQKSHKKKNDKSSARKDQKGKAGETQAYQTLKLRKLPKHQGGHTNAN